MSFGSSPVFLVLCLIAAGGFTFWTYRRTQPPLHAGKRAVLMGLRWLALAIVLFLLFEPVWQRVVRSTEAPVLAVLVDASQSLALENDGPPPLSLADSMQALLGTLPVDAIGADVRWYTFDGATAPAHRDSVAFRGARTDIAQALNFVRDDLEGANLSGVVLLSDGRYNTGRNPVYTAERFPVPVYAVAVGDTARRRDVQIRRVATNEIAYVGRETPVEVSVAADGVEGERVAVSLFSGGVRLASQTVTLRSDLETVVSLAYTPDVVGLQRLVVAVSELDGEVTYANNTAGVAVRVLENEKRIVVVASAPSPDLSALRAQLDADPDVTADFYTQQRPGQFYEGPLPADLGDADVLVLAGYPGTSADPATARRIADAAASLPTLFLLQRDTDLARLAEHFGNALPLSPATVRNGRIEAAATPTPAGLAHPVLALDGVDAVDWLRLPPLTASESRWQPAPDARVLATQTIRGIGLDDPLLVVRSRSGIRSAALLGAGWWRWQTLPDDLEDLGDVWPGLVSNLLQWLATRNDDRRVRVQPTQSLFDGGEPASFTGQVYDESLRPVDDATLEVTITAPDGTAFPHSMRALGNGRYTLDAGTLPEGTYRYSAQASTNGTALGGDTGSFAVGALTLEFRETMADAALMRQLARRSGGAYFTPATVAALADSVRGSGRLLPTQHRREEETPLWHLMSLLPVVLVLLTTEWVLRKRSGMV